MATERTRVGDVERAGCTICGEGRWSLLRQGHDLLRPESEMKFKLSRCLSCGHVMQTPIPDDEELRKAYSVDYAPYCCAWKESGWPFWKILRQLTNWRRLLCLKRYGKGRKLLEVGSGSGDFLFAAQRAGWNVKAVEYNDMLAASLRDELGLDVRTGELRPGLWEEGEFDVIAFWNVFEHLRNPQETLFTVSDYLTAGGSLFLQIPTLDGIESGRVFGQYWAPLDLPRHLNFFSRSSLASLCDRAGMDLVRFETPFLGTAWCYYASACNYANGVHHLIRRFLRIAPGLLLSAAALPYLAAQAWRGRGYEAFALITKR